MVRTRGPAVSADASGSLGRILTFSNWKGKGYVKHLASSRNPKTAIQTSCRQMMDYLTKGWDWLAKNYEATWKEYGDRLELDPYQAYLKYNLDRWGRFKGPTAFYPSNTTFANGMISHWGYDVALRTVNLSITLKVLNENWAVIIYRSTNNGFTPARDNAVHGFHVRDTLTHSWRDGPLPPDFYYYRAYPVGLGGKMSTWATQLAIAIPG